MLSLVWDCNILILVELYFDSILTVSWLSRFVKIRQNNMAEYLYKIVFARLFVIHPFL